MKQAKARNFVSDENISVPLFQNKWLDKLTRTHIAVPVTFFFVYAAGLLYYTTITTELTLLTISMLFAGGAILFTFVEYNVHKRLFHAPPDASDQRKKITYTVHGIHHDYPKDKQRLAMPPAMSVTISTVLLIVFRVTLGQYAFSTLAGFMVGYALYLVIHYSVHIFRPPNNFVKYLWVNHAIHHYSEEGVMFGVSSPFWDYVYGTIPKKMHRRSDLEVRSS
ncbi:MAG: sterol desaturase family protein [Saprospiraceae bacterium]|jgi:sterol desaturase/sphingolipid hydroxylase (fatty acid hydroxylase superfamily)|nr:sterol desaturase family protein [Saprospiraceae bacterium]